MQVSGDVTGLEWLTRDTLVATTSSGGAVMLGLGGLQVILASDWPRDLILTPDWLLQDQQPPPAPSSASYSRAVRLELHKRMQSQDTITLPSAGLNSRVLEAFQDSDEDEDDEDDECRRGAGAEVAPPTDMSYFNSGPSGGGNSRQGFRSHHDMADAFAAGLQANRK